MKENVDEQKQMGFNSFEQNWTEFHQNLQLEMFWPITVASMDV